MLYDILPPIIFFMSLGGVIVVVSRVLLRLRRDQATEQIKHEAEAVGTVKNDKIFQPVGRGVKAIRSRISLVSYYIKQTVEYSKKIWADAKQAWQERKKSREEAKKDEVAEDNSAANKAVEVGSDKAPVSGIDLPTTNWKDKISSFYNQRLDAAKEAIANTQSMIKTKIEERSASGDENLKTTTLPLERDIDAEKGQSKIKVTRIDNSKSALLKSALKKEEEQANGGQEEEIKKQAKTVGMLSQFLKREFKEEPHTPVDFAQKALKSGQYQRAEDILVPHIIQHAKDTEAYMVLGRVSLARQAWDEAIEVFEQVIKINPEQKGGFAALGFAAYKAGRFTRALQALQRAHDRDPANVKVLNNLLAIAERMDNKILQKSVLEDLAVLEPDKKEYKKKLLAFQDKEKIRA